MQSIKKLIFDLLLRGGGRKNFSVIYKNPRLLIFYVVISIYLTLVFPRVYLIESRMIIDRQCLIDDYPGAYKLNSNTDPSYHMTLIIFGD